MNQSTDATWHNAQKAIAELGEAATYHVPLGVLGPFSEWLGWPDWLRENTSLTGQGRLPQSISMADDILITANFLKRGHGPLLIKETLASNRLVTGPTAELIIRNAPTLNDALVNLTALIDVTNYNLKMSLARTGREARVVIKPTLPLGPILDFAAAIRMILIVRTLERFLFEALRPVGAHFTMAWDETLARFASEHLGEISFGAPENALFFPSPWLDKTNPDFDRGLWQLAQRRLQHARDNAKDRDLVKRLRRRIRHSLQGESRVPRLKEIAVEEGLGLRTVGRKLAKAGISFQQIVDDERKRLMEELIQDRSMTIACLAKRSGFSNASSFSRAFRSWFGTSPKQYRDQASI